jgi:hypothetical protein
MTLFPQPEFYERSCDGIEADCLYLRYKWKCLLFGGLG